MRHTIVGGEIVGDLEIEWSGSPPVEHDEMVEQTVKAKALGLPLIEGGLGFVPDNGRKLAVVGGGRSIIENEEKLRNWDGDIWTINGTYHWCKARGIDSTFIACDPHVIVAQWAKNVKKALVTTRCHPDVFKVLRESEAEVRTFDLDGERRVMSGSSTATASIHLGVLWGYKSITYFGCESSYPPGGSHAYMHEPRDQELIVEVGDDEFYTAPDFLMQALEMANIFRMTGPDGGLKEESGGLLRALIANYAYRITWVSKGLMDNLKRKTVQEAA